MANRSRTHPISARWRKRSSRCRTSWRQCKCICSNWPTPGIPCQCSVYAGRDLQPSSFGSHRRGRGRAGLARSVRAGRESADQGHLIGVGCSRRKPGVNSHVLRAVRRRRCASDAPIQLEASVASTRSVRGRPDPGPSAHHAVSYQVLRLEATRASVTPARLTPSM
jgi:hypothetical protein